MNEETQAPMTRDELRAELIGKKHKPERVAVTLFGCELEMQQPTLASILDARDDADERTRTADVFINYAYVPGTDERVFEEGDREVILGWPFGEELLEVQRVIVKLTGVDISNAEEAIAGDPLGDSL